MLYSPPPQSPQPESQYEQPLPPYMPEPSNSPYPPNPLYPSAAVQPPMYEAVAAYSYSPAAAVTPQPCGLAIASLAISLVSWFILPVIGGIVAVILGHSARNVIRRSNGTMSGSGMALAGLIIGYVQIAIVSIVILCVFYFIAAFASG